MEPKEGFPPKWEGEREGTTSNVSMEADHDEWPPLSKLVLLRMRSALGCRGGVRVVLRSLRRLRAAAAADDEAEDENDEDVKRCEEEGLY